MCGGKAKFRKIETFIFIFPWLFKSENYHQYPHYLTSSKSKVIIASNNCLGKAVKYSKLQLSSLFDKYNVKPLKHTLI